MSAVTQIIREELEKDKALKEAIAKALDFSEAHAAIEKAEELLKDMIRKESSQ